MNKARLKKYARLIVKCGLNVQKGQEVHVRCGIDQPEFVAMVVEECYKAGASKVRVDWSYMPVTKLNFDYRTLESLSEVTDEEKARFEHRVKALPCRLWLDSDDPDGLNGTDNEKIAKANQARFPILKPYIDATENKEQWCIAAVPGKEWAHKIFPHLSEKKAIEALWNNILDCSRVTSNPVAEWKEHNEDLASRCKFLNDCRFEKLEYKSSNGTDFTVGLNPRGRWAGGAEKSLAKKVYFNPNIPSEEVFTSPMRGVAEGLVVATKPLSYQGKLIENFSMRFENGKVVEVKAEKNQDLLEKMVSMDEGAAYLGECALIAYDSPINETGILFYNTLFDENASCHLAVGRGFNECLEGFEKMTVDECREAGINSSMIHVDFMIGSEDMSIVGIKPDGKRVQIFKNGNWAF